MPSPDTEPLLNGEVLEREVARIWSSEPMWRGSHGMRFTYLPHQAYRVC
jgi:hypothetical protein